HIAREMKVTKGFIYYYYKSKADIFYELHARAMEDMRHAILTSIPRDATPREKLRAAMAANIRFIEEGPVSGAIAARTAWLVVNRKFPAPYRKKLTEQRDQLRKIFAGILEEGIRSGVYQPGEVDFVVRIIMGALTWLPTWYRPGGRLAPDDVGEIVARMMRGPFEVSEAGRIRSLNGRRTL
ncbi:MAG: TetR/AcrR family transcriptional regulator, partial [Chloroflexi bacterium]|nr:TetR/AcrR family transcriptional regulator [Chloroflexota bacterium]